MAKISANGCHEVARVSATLSSPTFTYPAILVLRSDGAILRRFTGDLPSGYTILGRLKADAPRSIDTLLRIAGRRGYTVTNTKVAR